MEARRRSWCAAWLLVPLALMVLVGHAGAQFGGADSGHGGDYNVTLAVNPFDPDNVVMATFESNGGAPPTNGFLRCSIDGGATWTPPTYAPIAAGHENAGAMPRLAFDGQGRLFWCHITALGDGSGAYNLAISQINPVNASIVAGPHLVTNDSGGIGNEQAFLVADTNLHSPYAGRLYVAWWSAARMAFSWSDDQGQTWAAPQILASSVITPDEGTLWMPSVAVDRAGNVYVAYHSQPGFLGPFWPVPDGVSGQVFVLRSTDGGVSFPQKVAALGPGDADITFNVQHLSAMIPGTTFWTAGSTAPTVLADPVVPGRIYVVGADDPDDTHGVGDDADVVMAISTDYGQTWGSPTVIADAPAGSFQVFPVAAADPVTGALAVAWYDNRTGAVNGSGNYLLDWYAALSTDGGDTWSAPERVSDASFDPDLSPWVRFSGPPPTLRIGEYNSLALLGGTRYTAWSGNDADIQVLTESLPGFGPVTPWRALSGGTAGVAGVPELSGTGSLLADTAFRIDLHDAPPFAPMLVWLAFSPTPTAALGGTLRAYPPDAEFLLTADGNGELHAVDTWPAGIAPGTELYIQFLVADASALPWGISMSNGLKATAP